MASLEKKAKSAAMKAKAGGAMGYETSARRYVNAGINNLGIKPREKEALRAKLIPIVSRQMGSDRSRAATRGAAMVKRAAANKTKAAQKKILG